MESLTSASELAAAIASYLPFEPNTRQKELIISLAEYVASRREGDVFILNGYAGTGKTSVMGALVKALSDYKTTTITLAPTGRAAKVAASFSGGKASTIHKRIYRGDSTATEPRYFLARNADAGAIFIIDEASLVTDAPDRGGSLLVQLLRHIQSAPGCGIIFVGDTAQLPPVGQSDSPAMNPSRLRQLGLNPAGITLDTPARQAADSGILYNATLVRELITATVRSGNSEPTGRVAEPGDSTLTLPLPQFRTAGFSDITLLDPRELADTLSDSWARVGQEETIMITRSNFRANDYNRAVRNLVMMAEGPLQSGDRLVIAKNDYYWSKINKLDTFIANGDIVRVDWVGRPEKAYGRYFTDVEMTMADGRQIGAKIMMRSLIAEGPALPKAEMDRFFSHVIAEQEGNDYEKIQKAGEDPCFNALQAKYAYCVTCHKAQGGQWKHVYVDLTGIAPEAITTDYYRWLYTAMTRATEHLYLVGASQW